VKRYVESPGQWKIDKNHLNNECGRNRQPTGHNLPGTTPQVYHPAYPKVRKISYSDYDGKIQARDQKPDQKKRKPTP
jgi:hypothetical protein